MADLAAALAALYARVPLGMRLGLEPMKDACARADHPERAFRAVHVTGTNGKGSTCAMVESIARAAGLRTGLYTSPHLCRFAERIRIDGEPIADAELADLLDRAMALGPDLSFFETATLAAFLAFREHAVDLAVIEVGIGGRLDATNVLPPPACTAITKVELDHQDRLGDTLEEIAREKAGIAKAGSPLVLGIPGVPAVFGGEMTDGPVRDAARTVAGAAGARILWPVAELPDGVVGPPGYYQAENARMAWTIAAELGIPEDARARGLAAARWPGRFERVETDEGPWLLDGAHNPDGVRALVASLRSQPPAAIVFGALADKSWPAMLRELQGLPSPRFYAAPRGRAAADPAALAAHSAPGTATAMSSLPEALSAARRLASRGLVVVCGSLYLVGEARARLLGLPEDPPVSL